MTTDTDRKLHRNILVCIGSPLVDIIVKVTGTFLNKYNLEPNGATTASAVDPELLDEAEQLPNSIQLGGSVTNTARIVQLMLNTPGAVTHLGAIGRDDLGDRFKQKLSEEGVNYVFREDQNQKTGRCYVFLNENHRFLVTDLGAAKEYRKEDLERAKDILKAAKFVYISAFFLAVSIECTFEIAKFCQENEKILVLNLGAPFLSSNHPNEVQYLLKKSHIVFGNESEVRAFSKSCNAASDRLKDISLFINTMQAKTYCSVPLTVVTRGSSPIIVVQNGYIREYNVEEIDKDEVADTNGAGDAFTGGFLAQYLQGKSVDECVKCGIWAAKKIIGKHGFDLGVKFA